MLYVYAWWLGVAFVFGFIAGFIFYCACNNYLILSMREEQEENETQRKQNENERERLKRLAEDIEARRHEVEEEIEAERLAFQAKRAQAIFQLAMTCLEAMQKIRSCLHDDDIKEMQWDETIALLKRQTQPKEGGKC